MKGNNSIEMNQATLIEAVQEYFDKRWSGPPQEVMSVRASSGSRSDCLSVEVQLAAKEEKKTS